MRSVKIFLFVLLSIIPLSLFAVEYPIVSAGIQGGWGQNELEDGFFINGFMRYLVAAYFPGLHLDAGFSPSFFNSLKEREIKNPDPQTDTRTISMNMRNHIAYIGSSLHIKPFTKFASIYIGGGVDLNFINVNESVKDKYWDPVAGEYQEEEVSKDDILNKVIPGFHAMGGIRFLLGDFGTLDFEARQTFVNVNDDEWKSEDALEEYGGKSWNNFGVNIGISIFIF